MDVMQLRRNLLMMQIAEPTPEGVGIFTRGYEAILQPERTNSFTIPHNLGILPRLCVIEAVMSTVTATNYPINIIVDFDLYGAKNDKTGLYEVLYYYNETNSSYGFFLPDSKVTYDKNSISLKAPYSEARSPWDTSADYIVHVWG